jgi:hypothetical protein
VTIFDVYTDLNQTTEEEMEYNNHFINCLNNWFSELLRSPFDRPKQTFVALKSCYIYTLSKF